MNQDIVLAIALPITLFLIMFSMGTQLSLSDFKQLGKKPISMMTGISSQLIILPLLAFALMSSLQLPAEIFIGFMILALSPGGTTSNMFSYLAEGNLALSISLTAIISMITPLSIPIVGAWIIEQKLGAASDIQLPFLETLLKLIVITLVPVVLGMLLRHFKSNFCSQGERWITRIPLILLAMVIGGIILQNWQKMPYFISQTGIPALSLASLALVAGYLFARFMRRDETDARTIAIETSIQNGGTAILVTGTLMNNPAMTIAPVMYGILMLIPVLFYLGFIKYLRPILIGSEKKAALHH